MSKPDTRMVLEPPGSRRAELTHIECCRDTDLLLCGEDGAEMGPSHPADPACVPCHVAERDGTCPILGRCPEDFEVAS